MTTSLAIKVTNLSKRYRIGLHEEMPDSLAQALSSLITRPIRNYRRLKKLSKFYGDDNNTDDVIWALKGASFEIAEGEVVGIIGDNGAGKSTLLKILSRITDPTEGEAEVHGRVGSLLEVGTGFHPELTGRENTYLNGTILGMTRKEVAQKFDDIVEFSGIEKYIDTPVKRYSSGMRVRLAFAVAANLEPEILLVDEVLAVGDVAFQRKCLGKMGEVAASGRTIMFVSHNMGAVSNLCQRVIWLENGQVKLSGPASEIVSAYLLAQSHGKAEWTNQAPDDGSDIQLKRVRLLSHDSQNASVVAFDKGFRIELAYEVIRPMRGQLLTCRLTDGQGYAVLETLDTDSIDWDVQVRESGHYISTCQVPASLLRPGRYFLTVGSYVPRDKNIFSHDNVLDFEISHQGFPFANGRRGIITPNLEWQVTIAESVDRRGIRNIDRYQSANGQT